LPDTLVRFRRHDAQKSVDATRANDEIRAILAENLADRPEIGAWTRRRLRAELDYDIYQSGSAPGPRHTFAATLMRNPLWLLSTSIRGRIVASLKDRRRPPS
jgi:hypothetical protein